MFYPRHEIQSITYLDSGDILTTALRTITDKNGKERKTFVQFKSKKIVLSNGAHQILHPSFFKDWYPSLNTPEMKPRVILSDDFLKIGTYMKVMKLIVEKKLKKIVIVGGSHSGFSCAWLILNGPASYKHNNH